MRQAKLTLRINYDPVTQSHPLMWDWPSLLDTPDVQWVGTRKDDIEVESLDEEDEA